MNVKSGTLAKAAVAAALSCALASPFVAVHAYAAEDAPTNENDAIVAAAAAPEAEATPAAAAPAAAATPAEPGATPAAAAPAPAQPALAPAPPAPGDDVPVHQFPEQKLSGDLLINGDTTSSKPYTVKQGSTFSATGVLDVTKILEQMNAIEQQFNLRNPDGTPVANATDTFKMIQLSEVNSTFEITLELGEGLSFTQTDLAAIKLGNFGKFEIVGDPIFAGNKLTIKVKLNADTIKNYWDLRSEVAARTSGMNATVSGIKVSETAEPGKKSVIKGTVKGQMSAIATLHTRTFHPSFTWTAVQDASGKDSEATDPEAIQATVLVQKADPKPNPKPDTKPDTKPQPKPEAKPQPKHITQTKIVKKRSALPQTSDVAATALPAAVLALAGGLLAAAATVLRKRNEN